MKMKALNFGRNIRIVNGITVPSGARGSAVGWGTALQAVRSRVW